MKTARFDVIGMTCTGCENTLRRAIGFVDGVTGAEPDHASGVVVVTFDPVKADTGMIRTAIEDAGYSVTGVRDT